MYKEKKNREKLIATWFFVMSTKINWSCEWQSIDTCQTSSFWNLNKFFWKHCDFEKKFSSLKKKFVRWRKWQPRWIFSKIQKILFYFTTISSKIQLFESLLAHTQGLNSTRGFSTPIERDDEEGRSATHQHDLVDANANK